MSTTHTRTRTTFSERLAEAKREALLDVAVTAGYISAVRTALDSGVTYDIAEVLAKVEADLDAALESSHAPDSPREVRVRAALGVDRWVRDVLAWDLAEAVTVLDDDEFAAYAGDCDLPPGSAVVDVLFPSGNTHRFLLADFPQHSGYLAPYEAQPCRRCGERESCGEAYEVDHRYDGSLDDVCHQCLPAAYDDWEPTEAQLDAYVERCYGAR